MGILNTKSRLIRTHQSHNKHLYQQELEQYPGNSSFLKPNDSRWDRICSNGIWCKLYRHPMGYYHVFLAPPSNVNWDLYLPEIQPKIHGGLNYALENIYDGRRKCIPDITRTHWSWDYGHTGDYIPKVRPHGDEDVYYNREAVILDLDQVTKYLQYFLSQNEIKIPEVATMSEYMHHLYLQDLKLYPDSQQIAYKRANGTRIPNRRASMPTIKVVSKSGAPISKTLQSRLSLTPSKSTLRLSAPRGWNQIDLGGVICQIERDPLGFYKGQIVAPAGYDWEFYGPYIRDLLHENHLNDWAFAYSRGGDYIPLAEVHGPDDVYHTYRDVVADLTKITNYMLKIMILKRAKT